MIAKWLIAADIFERVRISANQGSIWLHSTLRSPLALRLFAILIRSILPYRSR